MLYAMARWLGIRAFLHELTVLVCALGTPIMYDISGVCDAYFDRPNLCSCGPAQGCVW